jgi:hypothetical protein
LAGSWWESCANAAIAPNKVAKARSSERVSRVGMLEISSENEGVDLNRYFPVDYENAADCTPISPVRDTVKRFSS